jgi:predicted Rossmann fold flavoprotein
MCAIEAGKRGRSVLVIEHNERLGKKILISGGGRCNFTNVNAAPENYLSANPHFHKSALARFTPADFIAMVERHGIAYHEKKLGQLFCDFSSREIVELLQRECEWAGVTIQLNCRVREVTKPERFEVETTLGTFSAQSLVVATGGLSFPKIGATDFGYRLARQFGLKVTATRPGLVPLTFAPRERESFSELSGVSLDVEVSAHDAAFRENVLFTHRGMSGPAILQISSYCQAGEPFTVNLLPDRNAVEVLQALRQSAKELKTVLSQFFPARFAQAWCGFFAESKPMHRYSNEELAAVARRLAHWEIQPADTEGYAKAEVTMGGVDTNELSSKTLESRRVPGLFFVGEVVDVTGWLGGYNFQWAWASGHAVGQNA